MSNYWEMLQTAQKSQADYGTPIPKGKHKLALLKFQEFKTKTGPAIGAEFIVQDSDTLEVGDHVSAKFYIASQFEASRNNALVQLREFIGALIGTSEPAKIAAKGPKLQVKEQPGTGISIFCLGAENVHNGKVYVNYTWEHVADQTPELIKATKKWVEDIYAQKKGVSDPNVSAEDLLNS